MLCQYTVNSNIGAEKNRTPFGIVMCIYYIACAGVSYKSGSKKEE